YLYAGFEALKVNAPRSVGAAAASPKMAAELILKSPARTNRMALRGAQ
ncbi:DNA adenine methylase, partial [Salmonella enterica subsp. enterica serovar Schwarzengrund]